MTNSSDKLAPLLAALQDLTASELTSLADAIEAVQHERATSGRQALLAEFRAKAEALGVSLDDLLGRPAAAASSPKAARATKKVAAKYRGPQGEEWTGRGRQPKWLTAAEAMGHTREDYRIK